MSKCKYWMALALAAQLAACGGGGGGGQSPVVSAPPPVVSPPTTTPPTTTPPAPEGNIVVTVPPPTYPATSGSLLVYTTINALRSKIGSGLLAQSALLDKSADAHANYIVQNGIQELHGETAGKPGFTGVRAADRIAAAGYTAAVSGEAIFSTTGSDKFASCVSEWANSVYHVALLFSSTIDIGVSASNLKVDPAVTLCVVDFATATTSTAQLPAPGSIRAYPYPDQLNVPFVFFNRTETPTPAPDLAETGAPVTVSFETKGLAITAPVAISQFTLTPAGGAAVEARILVNKSGKLGPVITTNGPVLTDDGQMQGFAATLIPVKRLQANTVYAVSLIAVVDGKTINKTWSFTTAAQ